jgi:hypothetical protein
MRAYWFGLVLTMAMLLPIVGNAQVYQFLTPPPDISAAGAEWQIASEPVVVAGLTYYPTRGFRLFDGHVMVQTGLFEGVPVYADATIEPFSEIYVPVGDGRMRVYERRREYELAGTTGSHVPAFPVDSPYWRPRPGRVAHTSAMVHQHHARERRIADNTIPVEPQGPLHISILTGVPRSGAPNGVWLEFEGARWYSDGTAVPFASGRFETIGAYRGFPVYRDRMSQTPDRLWVPVVKDGALAPCRRTK